MNNNITSQSILLYTSSNGDIKIDVSFQDETLWLTQKKLSELFNVERSVITKHLNNIFKEGELNKNSVCAKFAHTAEDGKKYNTQYYNLDAIIAVGYRVNSYEATQFRMWSTKILREFIEKGFVLDDERLKQGKQWGKDYFDNLLERIREIRTSERRFYQKITDIYAECSIDYDATSPVTETFYATVQNKLHWAIANQTAAEIIYNRTDSNKPNMGLTTWKNSPYGKILKSDVSIAKNYLSEKELKELNRIVTLYLDLAELQAERQIPMRMKDWVERLNSFLEFNGYNILEHAGKISAQLAKDSAEEEYNKFRLLQDADFKSDFDKLVSIKIKDVVND